MRPIPAIPRPVRLSVWANAWSVGRASLDEAVSGARGDDPPSVVVLSDGESEPLILAFRRLFQDNTALAVLPVPGFLLGLAGPDSFNRASLDCGGAVLTGAAGLIAQLGADQVVWHLHQITPSHHYETLREANFRLREALTEAAATFEQTELRPAREALLDELLAAERHPELPLPPTFDDQDERIVSTALHCLRLTKASLTDHAVDQSASAAALRSAALKGLDQAARRVVVAASAHVPRR